VRVVELFGQTRMSVLLTNMSLIVGRTFLSDSFKCLIKELCNTLLAVAQNAVARRNHQNEINQAKIKMKILYN